MKFIDFAGTAKCILPLLAATVFLSSCAGGGVGGSAGNKLNIGYGTTAPDTVDLKSQLLGLMNYNGKYTAELFAMRTKNANLHPELLQGPYQPSAQIFAIDGKLPWWGLKGYLFRGKGVNATDGVSRESPFFGNPFMLVAPEWYCTDLRWSEARFSKPQAFADSYPLFQQPTGLKIFPKDKREELSYDAMAYYNSIRALVGDTLAVSDLTFDINAYNAEDFGYNYIYVDPDQSRNMAKLPPEVLKIDQTLMVKHRETCADACNDIDSPDGMRGFRVKNLPAKCHLLLWRNKPTSHLDPPDLKVDLVFN